MTTFVSPQWFREAYPGFGHPSVCVQCFEVFDAGPVLDKRLALRKRFQGRLSSALNRVGPIRVCGACTMQRLMVALNRGWPL